MLRLLGPMEGVMVLAYVVSIFLSTLTAPPSYDLVARQAFYITQSNILLAKAAGEAYSYAYWEALSSSFDPDRYSDEANEQWNVPPFFSYPAGGRTATCLSIDGNIGCVVWNLEGGNLSDPCPTVKDYRPNPDPRTYLNQTVSRTSVENYLSQLVDQIREVDQERGISLSTDVRVLSTSPSSLVEHIGATYASSILRSSKNTSVTWNFAKDVAEVPTTARCECRKGGRTYTVATYDMNTVYVVLSGGIEGIKLLEERGVFIRYFTRRRSNSPITNPEECWMVIG